MARTSSSSVNPAVLGPLLILRGRLQAFQGVSLVAPAVLPGDVHLEVAQALGGLEAEVLISHALVGSRMPHDDARAEALGGGALLDVVDDLALEEERVHGRPP